MTNLSLLDIANLLFAAIVTDIQLWHSREDVTSSLDTGILIVLWKLSGVVYENKSVLYNYVKQLLAQGNILFEWF